ncbi:3-keto-L-gulonate 6-phosphate decarboxylase [Cutibacterium acnes JCM 18916]|nr:3-keto-L-gulonate 6-phosphate decarboxylase [Cutibacterium acnes JCM 18916]
MTTMPRLQIALDTYDLPSALAPLATAVDQIDIIECGTILVLAEGMDAVRAIRLPTLTRQFLLTFALPKPGPRSPECALKQAPTSSPVSPEHP